MVENFLNYMTNVRGCAPRSAETYRSALRNFASFLRIRKEHPSWSSVSVEDVASYVFYMRSNGLKPSTINVFIASATSFFDYLCRFHGLASNPAAMIDKMKEPKRLPSVIEDYVMSAFFCHFAQPSQMAFSKHVSFVCISIMYYAGLRASEVMSLRWCSIRENCFRIIGKGDKERIVPICRELREILDEYEWRQEGFLGIHGDFIVCKNDGSAISPSFLRREVKEILVACGCPSELAHPHSLRHAFATRMAAMGLSLVSLQKILGHTSLNTTQIYVNLADSFASSEFFNLTNSL